MFITIMSNANRIEKPSEEVLKNGFIALTVFMLLFLFLIGLTQKTNVKAENFPEYQKYMHAYLNSQVRGNWTYMEKPLFPVFFNTSQIGIGQNWSIVCPP